MSKTSLDKSKIKFLLLEGVHQNAVDTLKAAGYTNIEYLKTALSGDELKERIADAHFIGIRSRTQLTEEVFDCAKKLIAVGCFCIGTNQVDLNAARERGIAVFNAPYSNTRSVAEPGTGRGDPAAARHPGKERLLPSRRLDQERGEFLRDPWQEARHRRLRLDRHPALGTRRGPGHAGVLLRHRDQAAAGQRGADRQPARAAGHVRHRLAARSRTALHPVDDRREGNPRDEEGRHPDQRRARHSGRAWTTWPPRSRTST